MVRYTKTYPDGTTFLFEKGRRGRKELALVTMYKHIRKALSPTRT